MMEENVNYDALSDEENENDALNQNKRDAGQIYELLQNKISGFVSSLKEMQQEFKPMRDELLDKLCALLKVTFSKNKINISAEDRERAIINKINLMLKKKPEGDEITQWIHQQFQSTSDRLGFMLHAVGLRPLNQVLSHNPVFALPKLKQLFCSGIQREYDQHIEGLDLKPVLIHGL